MISIRGKPQSCGTIGAEVRPLMKSSIAWSPAAAAWQSHQRGQILSLISRRPSDCRPIRPPQAQTDTRALKAILQPRSRLAFHHLNPTEEKRGHLTERAKRREASLCVINLHPVRRQKKDQKSNPPPSFKVRPTTASAPCYFHPRIKWCNLGGRRARYLAVNDHVLDRGVGRTAFNRINDRFHPPS